MNEVESTVLGKFTALLRQRFPVYRVIFYESRARGDAHSQSELDVVVILGDAAGSGAEETVSACAWEAGFDQGVVVTPVVFTRSQWEDGPEREPLFVKAVQAEGVVL